MADIYYKTPTINTANLLHWREGYRQKPFVEPKDLFYRRQLWVRTSSAQWGNGGTPPKAGELSISSGIQALLTATNSDTLTANWLVKGAYSRAYNKLLSKMGERAQLLTALAERTSTFTMVLNRLTQIWRGLKYLRRGRFRDFLKTFGVKPLKKHQNKLWSRPREASSLWLEYWFGWSPTIADIATAVDVWQRPVGDFEIRAASGMRNTPIDDWVVRSTYTHETKSVCSFMLLARCRAKVTNPDLWLANQLGFINPAATALELVPFSWLAGWFVNLQQVLNSFSDTVGLQISDVWVTRFAKATETQTRTTKDGLGGFSSSRHVMFIHRKKFGSLPRPNLVFRIPGVSWTRAATLSSLIVQLFSPTGRPRS